MDFAPLTSLSFPPRKNGSFSTAINRWRIAWKTTRTTKQRGLKKDLVTDTHSPRLCDNRLFIPTTTAYKHKLLLSPSVMMIVILRLLFLWPSFRDRFPFIFLSTMQSSSFCDIFSAPHLLFLSRLAVSHRSRLFAFRSWTERTHALFFFPPSHSFEDVGAVILLLTVSMKLYVDPVRDDDELFFDRRFSVSSSP